MIRIVGLVVLLLLLISCKSETSYYEVKASDNLKKITLTQNRSIKLKSGMDTIGFVKKMQVYKNQFFIVDPFYARKAMLFDNKGNLLHKYSKRGQGPGETPILMSGLISDDKVVLYGNYRVNIYDLGGKPVKQLNPPLKGICSNMYPGDSGSFYLLSFHRSNRSKDSIYKYDSNFNLIDSFSPYDREIPPAMDTFAPQTSICFKKGYLFQVFNYKYEILKFNPKGKLVKRIKLNSPFYTAPDLSRDNVYGHVEERKYRATFTQVTGIHNWKKGFVICLINWKSVNKSQVIYEFWSENFEYLGYAEPRDEQHFGVFTDNQLVMVEQKYEHTQINIFDIKL